MLNRVSIPIVVVLLVCNLATIIVAESNKKQGPGEHIWASLSADQKQDAAMVAMAKLQEFLKKRKEIDPVGIEKAEEELRIVKKHLDDGTYFTMNRNVTDMTQEERIEQHGKLTQLASDLKSGKVKFNDDKDSAGKLAKIEAAIELLDMWVETDAATTKAAAEAPRVVHSEL